MHFRTADLCDLHTSDVTVATPLFSDFGGLNKFSGAITTIKCLRDNSLVRDTLNTPGHGGVLVVDGGGTRDCSLLGDALGKKAIENAWAGLVIYGCVRDSEILKTLRIGIKALATCPLKTTKKGRGQKNVPVHFAGIDFIPQYWLCTDPDGIVVSKTDLSETP